MYHDGETFDIDIKILAQCYGKPTRRMITESVMIDELSADMTMNNKSEWSYVKLSKVGIDQG